MSTLAVSHKIQHMLVRTTASQSAPYIQSPHSSVVILQNSFDTSAPFLENIKTHVKTIDKPRTDKHPANLSRGVQKIKRVQLIDVLLSRKKCWK